MEINASNMATLFTALDTRFKSAFQEAVNPVYKQITLELPVSSGIVDFPVVGQLAGMREWVGPRLINKLHGDKLTVRATKLELTYGIPVDAISDDQYDMYVPLIAGMATQAANMGGQLVTGLLNDAINAQWADGADFFGSARKYGDGVKSKTLVNLGTTALSASAFKTAYSAMCAYTGHGGGLLGVRPTVLAYGPALTWVAKALIETPLIVDSGVAIANPLYNIVRCVEIPGLLGNKWFLFDDRSPVAKPLGLFVRQAPDTLVRKDQPTDDSVFNDDQCLYGVTGRATAVFLFPHLAYFSNVAN